jgi:DNA-nicking Smr family endonuclease
MPDESFFHLLGDDAKGLEPLAQDARIALQQQRLSAKTLEARRLAATCEPAPVKDPLSDAPVAMLTPDDFLSFQRPGVQHGVFKNLRLGYYAIEARLDLHRETVESARRAVFRFAQDCAQHGVRTALITHGKGEGRATPALLKSHVASWLPQLEVVLAFHTAQRQHGGLGATYVLFKKGAAQKEATRELFRGR